mmetsp:Transcript_73884/g.163178  ORF Transcript_73884/g.163178 Transcript_73884/m.163178 type:complete len:413 (-) Transcript_73884:740-1978(-)
MGSAGSTLHLELHLLVIGVQQIRSVPQRPAPRRGVAVRRGGLPQAHGGRPLVEGVQGHALVNGQSLQHAAGSAWSNGRLGDEASPLRPRVGHVLRGRKSGVGEGPRLQAGPQVVHVRTRRLRDHLVSLPRHGGHIRLGAPQVFFPVRVRMCRLRPRWNLFGFHRAIWRCSGAGTLRELSTLRRDHGTCVTLVALQDPKAVGIEKKHAKDCITENVEPGRREDKLARLSSIVHRHVLEETLIHRNGTQSTLDGRPWEAGQEAEEGIVHGRPGASIPRLLHRIGSARRHLKGRQIHGEHGGHDSDKTHQESNGHDWQDCGDIWENGKTGLAANHGEEHKLSEDPDSTHGSVHLFKDLEALLVVSITVPREGGSCDDDHQLRMEQGTHTEDRHRVSAQTIGNQGDAQQNQEGFHG